jgi:hypothetical protein
MCYDRGKGMNMDWMKKHVDTVIIIGAIITSMLWMNGKFNDVEKEVNGLKTDIAIIKTVLIMKQIMPVELAKHEEK